jgi:hypothetical protein
MTYLHTLLLLFFVSSISWGSEISALPLYAPVSYQRDPNFALYLASPVEIFIGNKIKISINEEIKKKIVPFYNDLSKYFPKVNELNNLVDSLSNDINITIVKGNLDDEKLKSIYSYLGKNLIGKIADRILLTEGINDEKRRSLWINKILEPFNFCITSAQDARHDAAHCMTALTANLVPNIGSAIVYELSRANLSSSLPEAQQTAFNQTQLELYRTCLNNFLPSPGPTNVNDCSLVAMKNAVTSISGTKLGDTLKTSTSSNESSEEIKRIVWPSFNSCVQQVSKKAKKPEPLAAQFSSCVDKLVVQAGEQIVLDKVEHNASLQLSFTNSELTIMSKDQALQFKKCGQKLIDQNIRKNGVIDTSSCENSITNALVYQTVLRKFKESIPEQVKDTNIDANTLEKDSKSILDRCWKMNQSSIERESCLRKSIIEFSANVAEKRLSFSIPATIASKKTIQQDSLIAFRSCLDKNLPTNISQENQLSAKMAPCTSALLRSATSKVVEESVDVALRDNLGDKNGVSFAKERSAAREPIMQDFYQCLTHNTDLTACTDQVTKNATLSIALAVGRVGRAEQINPAGPPPSEYLAIEKDLKACTTTTLTGDKLSKLLDDCKKKFAIEVTRFLGIEKFNTTLKSLLGEKKYTGSGEATSIILKKYNTCLDKLYHDYTDITFCTKQLARDGELLFKENVNQWMSSGEKDAATLAIKAQFTDFLPCLGGLLPANSNSPSVQVEKDVAPFMEIMAKAIAQYIEYSPENAKQNLDELIKQFANDLSETTDIALVKKNIVELLHTNGAFDQFLKSYIRKIVGDSFANIPDSLIPKQLKASLISKDNFDAIFLGPDAKRIQEAVLNDLINPIIIDGKSGSSPELIARVTDITKQVTHLLINSPYFGEKIIASQVQGSLDNIGAIKGLFVKIFYGGSNALVWEKIRQTPEGQIAENYIKENIMTPKFNMTTVSTIEINKRNEEAERLVGIAVKQYREPTK